jgi:ABC-2 type transport system ATP-binding protein
MTAVVRDLCDRRPMLELRDVSKSYNGVPALSKVNLDIAPGEILGLLGPNGAGKTTLISLTAGLLAPSGGEIRIGGLDLQTNLLQARRLLGVAPQELGIYLQLTVSQNLRFFARLAGLRRHQITERLETVADALDLRELLHRRAQDLSGGEKRRLHTAAALLHGAKLLLLDEPTAGVDVDTRNHLLGYIRSLAAEGTAVCYATHYLHEVEALDASVAILEGGRVTNRGTVAELIATFDEAVVEITFESTVPPGMATHGRVDDEENILRIRARDPATALSNALASLGDAANRIQAIEVVKPSLESAYLAMTGRRFDPKTQGTDHHRG